MATEITKALFTLLRFCYDAFLLHQSYPFTLLCFCAFALLRFCEACYWILQRFQKPPFLCVHIDQMCLRKPPFLWISIFDCVFESLRFCGVFVQFSVNNFSETEVFSPFLCKNGAV